jgi:hypothetical protein
LFQALELGNRHIHPHKYARSVDAERVLLDMERRNSMIDLASEDRAVPDMERRNTTFGRESTARALPLTGLASVEHASSLFARPRPPSGRAIHIFPAASYIHIPSHNAALRTLVPEANRIL